MGKKNVKPVDEKNQKKDHNFQMRKARQAAFLEVYKKNFGNKADACRVVGIGRKTFYLWLKKYPSFKKAIEEIDPAEESVEWLESLAYDKIRDGSDKLLIFALKAKAGWSDHGLPPNNVPSINVTIGKAEDE